MENPAAETCGWPTLRSRDILYCQGHNPTSNPDHSKSSQTVAALLAQVGRAGECAPLCCVCLWSSSPPAPGGHGPGPRDPGPPGLSATAPTARDCGLGEELEKATVASPVPRGVQVVRPCVLLRVSSEMPTFNLCTVFAYFAGARARPGAGFRDHPLEI